MTIEERLKELKKWELESLSRNLKVTGWSGLNKQPLIDHIISRCTGQDITAILDRDFPLAPESPKPQLTDLKIPWWERYKIARFIVIFGIIGTLATIIALLITIKQGQESKKSEINQVKWREEFSKKLEQFGPIKRDQIINQLKKVNKELIAALKDEKSGNTEERKEAFKALNNGNPTKAQELFKKRIEKDKNNLAENHFNLGNAYYVELKIEEALESYNKAIEIKPDSPEAWSNKGLALAALGRYEEALKVYDKAIEIKPDLNEAWSNKGLALYYLGRYEEALKACYKAIEIKPDLNEAWSNKGITLYALGRYEEALKAYDKAIEIKPDDYGSWSNKGLALAALGRYEEALKAYDKAIEIKPDLNEAWNNKGITFAALGRYEEALKAYDKAIEIKPDSHVAWTNKGVALEKLGRKKEAQKAFEKADKIKKKLK